MSGFVAVNAILFPISVTVLFWLIKEYLFIVNVKMVSAINKKTVESEKDAFEALIGCAIVINTVWWFICLLLGVFVQIAKKQLLLFGISSLVMVVLSVIFCFYLKNKPERKKYMVLCKYMKTMDSILFQLRNIDKMSSELYTNATITETDRKEQIKSLNVSEKTLRKAYADIKQAYNSMVLLGTFKEANALTITDESKKELEKQIDVFESAQRL